MRAVLVLSAAALVAVLAPAPGRADPLAACRDFFTKFQTCVDRLEGEQQEEARIFMKTLRGTLGMNDSLNAGDPNLTGMMCRFTMDEVKKDPSVKKYNCTW